VYGDLRQVYDVSTKTGDRCLILGRGRTDLLLTASRNKCIGCTADDKAATALNSILTSMAYMQLHYHHKHLDVGPYRTDWLHSKQRKKDSGGVNQYTALLRGLCRLRYIVCPDFER
jgi:hypothetical protein